MPSVNFYLKKPEGSPARSLIYLQFKYSGKRLVYSFGQTIEPGNWSKAKKRVKNNKQTTDDGQHSLNDLLDNLEKVCMKAYNENLADGVPATSVLRDQLDAFMNKNAEKEEDPKIFALFDRFISGEIKHKGKDKADTTLKGYKTVKGHLQGFNTKKKYGVTFDTVNLDFFYQFTSYLKNDLKLRPNTIGKSITILKTVMAEAVDLGYTTNMQFKHKKFTYQGEDSDAVYLTEQEIIKLFRHKFAENRRLEQVRDLFVFGCFVGLRYSDYSTIQPENIVQIDGDQFIKTITKKTKEQVIIPCHPIILEIFDRYKDNYNRLPKAPSNQKFNDYIKEVCRKAELTEVGRLASDPKRALSECVSSHTARRSMATNYYLQGFPTIDLMKITGHKTEKAFLRYIRVSKLDVAKRMNEHIKKNWSMKILKVAV